MIEPILIVDDELLARERLADLVGVQAPTATLREAGVGTANMPAVIFVTAHDEFAIRAFDVAAVDYLLKPFDNERFSAAWQRVLSRHSTGQLLAQAQLLSNMLESHGGGRSALAGAQAATPTKWTDRLVVKQDRRTMVVMLADVQWIGSDGNYVALHVGRERLQMRETLTSLESRLDPHRSVLFV